MRWLDIALGLTLGLAISSAFWGLRFSALAKKYDELADMWRLYRRLNKAASEVVAPPAVDVDVFLGELTDWGEDFTGEGDTLPRWRWTITDPHGMVVMLGNSPNETEAIWSITGWMHINRPAANLAITSSRTSAEI